MLIPIKSLRQGKSRLQNVLSAGQRASLNESLFRQAIAAAIDYAGRERTAVVSSCTEALDLTATTGALPIAQRVGAGLNDAVKQGITTLRAFDARDVLITAADLPLITAAELGAFVAASAGSDRAVLIGTDKLLRGTNALHLPASATFDFQFGVDSCGKHFHAAAAAGFQPRVWFAPRLAFDIDTPEDLETWRNSGGHLLR